MRASVTDDGVRTFAGDTERATLVTEGDTMKATWEQLGEDVRWQHWMDMDSTRA